MEGKITMKVERKYDNERMLTAPSGFRIAAITISGFGNNENKYLFSLLLQKLEKYDSEVISAVVEHNLCISRVYVREIILYKIKEELHEFRKNVYLKAMDEIEEMYG